MPILARILTFILGAVLLTACATYPLGLSEDEWNRLSSQQQLQARAQQAEIDQAERERRAEAARRRAEQEQAEQERYQQALQSAAPGDVVQCVMQSGEGYLGGSWRAAAPVGFTLLRDHPQSVQIAEQGRPTRNVSAQVLYDGANVRVCRANNRDCANLVATQNQLRDGVTQSIEVNRAVRGQLYCDIPNVNHGRGRH